MSKVVSSDGFNDFRAARWRCPEMPQVQQEYTCFDVFISAEMADFSKKNMQQVDWLLIVQEESSRGN